MSTEGLGRYPVAPPVAGTWPFQGLPPNFSLNGRSFQRARIASPFYSGVVGQYREAAPFNAQHLLVYGNGTFLVDHVDEVNPDYGNVAAHALLDVGEYVAVGAAVMGVTFGLVVGLYAFGP